MNYINLRKNNLCVENLRAYKLVKKYKTPFYCYSLAQLKNNFINFSKAFISAKPLICFSVKSNSSKVDFPSNTARSKAAYSVPYLSRSPGTILLN